MEGLCLAGLPARAALINVRHSECEAEDVK